MPKSVLGAGLVAVDHVFIIKAKRSTRSGYTYLGSTGGGSVSNTLCMLSLLGHKTHIFGIVGNDYSERIVSSDFAKFDVDYSLLVQKGGPEDFRRTRQFSHIVFADGSHSFREKCLKCNLSFLRQIQMTCADPTEKVKETARKVDVLHIDRANQATEELATIAVQNGHAISFDVGFESYGLYRKSVSRILEHTTLVKITEQVFSKHIGAADEKGIRLWWERYPENKYLLVTRGVKGVYGFATIESERKIFDLKAIPCEHLRDSAGAGDVFAAIAIHKLLLGHPPSTEDELSEGLGHAQALASLSCTLYGARALQFLFLNQGVSSEGIISWASTILSAGKSGNSLFPLIGLRDRDRFDNPSRLAPFQVCAVCGAPLSSRSVSKSKTKAQIKHVNLDWVPWSMNEGFTVGRIHRSTLKNSLRAPIMFIGSGGSLSASVFGEQLVLRKLGGVAKAIAPFDFEKLDFINEDAVVWLLSYGGSNPDIMGAALRAAKLGVQNCVVLTGARNSRLANFAKDHSWKTVFLKAEERGFVSTIGMLAMISALTGLFIPDKEIDQMVGFFSSENLFRLTKSADKVSREIANNVTNKVDSSHIIALGSTWGWPAVVDFESKIVEGGVCTIEVSEIKNFTHGRYINALYHRQNRHFILFSSPLENELVTFLIKKLRRYFPQRLDVLRTDFLGAQGAIDLIIQSMLLAFRLGEKMGRDLLKPKYPPEARGLYGWEPQSRKEMLSTGPEVRKS